MDHKDSKQDSVAIAKCKDEIQKLTDTINKHKSEVGAGEGEHLNGKVNAVNEFQLKVRRQLKGHFGKIYAMDWRGTSNPHHLVSASQDGKLLIWNAMTTSKLEAIPLRSSWVMTTSFSPNGNLIMSGGLDNLCTIYSQNAETKVWNKSKELAHHEGYLSCGRFVDEGHIITSSGDSSCILWDIQTSTPVSFFTGHTADVMSVSLNRTANVFVSGSVDFSCRLWDYRSKGCITEFVGHESDVNALDFYPDGHGFVSASDDSSIRLWDIRAYCQLNKYASEKILCGLTSVACSKGGRFIFAGYDDYNWICWDLVNSTNPIQTVLGENRVSCVGVSSDGFALCTGSWDTTLKIYA